MQTPDTLALAFLMAYWDNKQTVDVAMQHISWVFVAWLAAVVDRLLGQDGSAGGNGGLTIAPGFA